MTWTGVAVAGGAVVSSLIASNASKNAAQTQADAANNASAQQLAEFNTINNQQAPWREQGQNALTRLSDLLGTSGNKDASGYGSLAHTFNASDLNTNLAPGYQFMLNQGLGQTKNMANATGGLLSGNTLQGLTKYAEDYASNGYQQAFDNYNTNQNNIFNRLSTLAGFGQSANQTTANAGQNAVTSSGNFLTSGAAAQAAGQVGSANAISGGLSSLGSLAMFNSLNNGGGGSGGGGGSTLGSLIPMDSGG